MGAAMFVTYSRLAPELLYNVSHEGVAGGASRLLVFSNYPVALAAIAIAWLAAERVDTRWASWAAGIATVLCAVTAWPGVVDQHNLDAKPVNAMPALGVAIALGLTVRARWERVGRLLLDPVRLGVGVAVWLVALVYVAAALGYFFPGDLFLGEELRRGGDGRLAPAVHLGEHEGLDAALLVTSALLLTRYRPRAGVLWVLSLAFVYGLGVEWRDFWFEQIVKRDWTSWAPPAILTPRAGLAWAGVIVLSVVVAVLVRRLEGRARSAEGPRRTSPSPVPGRPTAESTTGEQSP